MRTYIVTIDEKKMIGDPEQALMNLKGVKSVASAAHSKKSSKTMSDNGWINPEGRTATNEEIELLAKQMECESDFVPIEEARKLGHQLIEKWSKKSPVQK